MNILQIAKIRNLEILEVQAFIPDNKVHKCKVKGKYQYARIQLANPYTIDLIGRTFHAYICKAKIDGEREAQTIILVEAGKEKKDQETLPTRIPEIFGSYGYT